MQKWSKFADMIEIKRDINIPETSFFPVRTKRNR